jgi:hypothetical protein
VSSTGSRKTLREVIEWIAPSGSRAGVPVRRWSAPLGWPPDVFAVAATLLEESGAYRLILSPPPGRRWPPPKAGGSSWVGSVIRDGDRWHQRTDPVGRAKAPRLARECWSRLLTSLEEPIDALLAAAHWDLLVDVATLLALSDEACAGLGASPVPGSPVNRLYALAANARLSQTGSLSRLPPERVKVLPKMRTPQVGASLRSLSLFAAIDRSELDVRWLRHGELCESGHESLNLLLLPWPERIVPTDFRTTRTPKKARFGLFEFAPKARTDLAKLRRAIDEAKELVETVHAVILPEAAAAERELGDLERALEAAAVPMLLCGARARRRNFARLALLDSKAGWMHHDQPKHHRWKIDSTQIRQYHIGAALDVGQVWWEDIEIERRCVNVVAANDWLTLLHLICEDLARVGPGVSLIRSIGPTLVVALLLDGPQLASRWSGRYASVLADDPGSSVLTLAPIGMVERSRPAGAAASRVVGLWKDSDTGVHELVLEPGATGIVITVSARWKEEFSADWRSDRRSGAELGSAAELVLTGVQQVRLP